MFTDGYNCAQRIRAGWFQRSISVCPGHLTSVQMQMKISGAGKIMPAQPAQARDRSSFVCPGRCVWSPKRRPGEARKTPVSFRAHVYCVAQMNFQGA
jgi:hypothetical protein